MSRVFLRLVLLGVIGSAAVPARLSAQPAPTVDKKQAAKQYTEAGLTAAKLGDYDTAISFYQKAYLLVPHPTLTFNIAEAQRLAGRVDQALALYKRYLSDAPNGPLAQDARDRIAEISASRAEEARKAEEERKATGQRSENERKIAEAHRAEDARHTGEVGNAEETGVARDHAAAAVSSPSATPGATSPQNTSSAPTSSLAPKLTIALGATAVVAGAIAIAFNQHPTTAPPGTEQPRAYYDTKPPGIGLVISGAVTSIGGYLWWRYTRSTVAPTVAATPGGTTVGITKAVLLAFGC